MLFESDDESGYRYAGPTETYLSEEEIEQDERRLVAIRRAKDNATNEWAKNFFEVTEQRLIREFRWKTLTRR
jgi:hypothetical protein